MLCSVPVLWPLGVALYRMRPTSLMPVTPGVRSFGCTLLYPYLAQGLMLSRPNATLARARALFVFVVHTMSTMSGAMQFSRW